MDFEGTISRGIRAPIIREGDDIVEIVKNSIVNASKTHGITLHDKDVVAVTEAVVARAQGNYVSCEDIGKDIANKFGEETVGVVFPIFSRNRFSLILKGIATGAKKVVIQLSYPSDEVGNSFVSAEDIEKANVNPYSDVFTSDEFHKTFPDTKHIFTGVDYINFYKEICGGKAEIILANNPKEILKHTKYVINADIHNRKRTKKALLDAGAKKVLSLDEIMTAPVGKSGYNDKFGVLGSNMATDDKLKLFPRDAQIVAEKLHDALKKATGKDIECMVYGDGAFKDPVGKIWELADPVCSPGFTKGLLGTPNEIKLKYVADTQIAELTGEEAEKSMKEIIKNKQSSLKGEMLSQGTTPRQLTDLLASLSDLTSGSGDKGTPIVLIQNYFKNYSD